MLFYKKISNYYDKIFPLNKTTEEFLSKEFSESKKILDLACGDGKYTDVLAGEKRFVSGVDLDRGMLETAKEKYGSNPNAEFLEGNMLELSKIFTKDEFDGIFCIGNSLVHLTSLDLIERFIKETHFILKNNGRFIVQIINYDRILDKNIDFLPAIKNEGVEFIRNYHRKENSRIIDFHTILKTPEGDIESHQDLYSIRKDELINLFTLNGFIIENEYSSFGRDNWNEDSLQSIFVFLKK